MSLTACIAACKLEGIGPPSMSAFFSKHETRQSCAEEIIVVSGQPRV